MKFLKWLVIIIASLVIIVLVASLILPKELDIERTATINAPADVVWENVIDFKKWEQWSPFKEMDPESKQTYYGEKGQVGSGYSWVGPKSGEGKLTAASINANKELNCDMLFIKPFETPATAGFKLAEENGATKITWTFHAHYDMPFNVMAVLFGGSMGETFDHGLATLKTVSEKQAAEAPAYDVQAVSFPATHYLMVRKQMKWSEITSEFFANNYKAIGENIGKQKLKMSGAPSGLVFVWDEANQTTDMAAAIPVSEAKGAAGDIQAYSIDSTAALMVDYYGAYDQMSSAYTAMQKYAAKNGLKIKYPSVEQYVTDPMSEPDTAKWLTKIYNLLEK